MWSILVLFLFIMVLVADSTKALDDDYPDYEQHGNHSFIQPRQSSFTVNLDARSLTTVNIQTPRYPKKYPSKTQINWKVQVTGEINFFCPVFNLRSRNSKGNCRDYLEVEWEYDGIVSLERYCGEELNNTGLKYKTNRLNLTFKSSKKQNKLFIGFNCTMSSPDCIKCGIETPYAQRVVNGEPVNAARKYSWQVGLSLDDNPYYNVVCGGSIITNKHILTAAHCFDYFVDGQTYFIGIGSNKQDNTTIVIPQAQVFIHTNYSYIDYDIAIIELSQPIDLVKYGISPICIPRDDTNDYAGLNATVSGWGSTVGYNPTPTPPPTPEYPNILQEAQIPVLANNKCIEEIPVLTERMLCTGDNQGFENGGKDSCQGDSGGPLTVQDNGQYRQIGIVSFGRGCASKGNPGVYARVTEFLDWIDEKVAPEKIYTASLL